MIESPCCFAGTVIAAFHGEIDTCVDLSKLGAVVMVNGGHRANPSGFWWILGLDLMPTAADMPKFVDVIMVNKGHLA